MNYEFEDGHWSKSIESTTRRGDVLEHDLDVYHGEGAVTFVMWDMVNTETQHRCTWEVAMRQIPDEEIHRIMSGNTVKEVLSGFNPHIKAGFLD